MIFRHKRNLYYYMTNRMTNRRSVCAPLPWQKPKPI